MAYYRKSSEKTLLVIGNYQTEPQTVTLPQELKKVVLNNLPTLVEDGKTLTLTPGYQAVVLEVSKRRRVPTHCFLLCTTRSRGLASIHVKI